ncbi:hypothetical protein Sulku_2104 [Sulfuricurvum kujiense DSM 16994]|uniref:Uncharacterized protein n=1 Tax=Sulfuricurvum kujiense (strain ATCC BAA-921 / DSM 16994 / JCM 11577 / YK-1) TaxID=709032 RepID=E4U300_SULKY|nr:hypothetical protein [Sulfuricurvum kujiense]ADR34764.1 hypothetical protein Sulku_2104 [Sulfuricurvum kujiense DSM 16994]
MSKLDEVKEILNTLRVAMTIGFGLLVVIVGGLIKRYDDQIIDTLFWSGVGFAVLTLTVIVLLMTSISKKTKEIKEL